MSSKIHVYLRLLSSDASLEDLSDLYQIPNSCIWRKGETRPGTILRHKENGWELKSDLDAAATVAEHVSRIMSLIDPYRSKISELQSNWETQISCALYYYGDCVPESHFEPRLVNQMSDLGASLDVDVYDLS